MDECVETLIWIFRIVTYYCNGKQKITIKLSIPLRRENIFSGFVFCWVFLRLLPLGVVLTLFFKGTIFFGGKTIWHLTSYSASRPLKAPGFANLPARMAEQASAMYAQNMANLLRHVHAKGGLKIQSGKGSFNQAHLQKG